MRTFLAIAALALAACSPSPSMDAGTGGSGGGDPVDSGPSGPACTTSRECKLAQFDGACRAGFCTTAALCTDDVECGLGESCLEGACRFTGCANNADCATGTCRLDVFTCAECGKNADCPSSRPVCDTVANTCVQCSSDDQCGPPGPSHCDKPTGACVHCLVDAHCPNGLSCNAAHVCTGAKLGAACPMGTACDSGLICVALGGVNTCLASCSLATPNCTGGQICYKLTFTSSTALVFDQGGPLGVCYQPGSGLRNLNEPCTRQAATVSTSNCQPNLVCVPDGPTGAVCRTYCDLQTSGACPGNQKCHPFRGDQNGRLYGLCYPDTGWGDVCTTDATCRTGQSCAPYEDPSAADRLSTVCQYNVGTSPGLAPCSNVVLPDAGVVLADRTCASGACAADPLFSSNKFFCYAGCKTNADCTVGARTGVCDGDFAFPAGGTTPGKVKGCRPACTTTAACAAEYGSAIVCRSRFTPSYNASFVTSCAPPAGFFGPGQACTGNGQCRSGFCLVDDGRGVARKGVCADPCETAADCAPLDAGVNRTGPLACDRQTFMGFKGFDNMPVTPDDLLLTAKMCHGAGCTADDDCGVDAGVVCVPDVDPADAGRSVMLRCRPPHELGVLGGGAPCNQDADCRSGVCGALQPPSTSTGKACFHACTAATACPGTTTCRVGGMRITTPLAFVSLDSCAP